MVSGNNKVLFWDEIKKRTDTEAEIMTSVAKPIDGNTGANIDVGELIDHMFGTANEREDQSARNGATSEGDYALGNTGDNLGEMLCVTDAQAKLDLQIIQSVSN